MKRAHAHFVGFIILALGAAFLLSPKPVGHPGLVGAAASVAVVEGNTAPSGDLYIETTEGCGPYYEGTCVNLRAGPGTDYPVVLKLRNNMVLRVASTSVQGGETWYRLVPSPDMRYPERVTSDWWVNARYVREFYDAGQQLASSVSATSSKRILIDLAAQTLYAYDGTTTIMQAPISTGLADTPTPIGSFFVLRKVPDSYMQGPIPGCTDQYYDLPGVPWDLYFTSDGAAIHGAYWHNNFGQEWSHGCVNLEPAAAQRLYGWAEPGTPVIVRQ
jgi:lipoprotein-anchoring transpeptidase ErfK/SrfK